MIDIDSLVLDVTSLMTANELEKCELVIEKGKRTFLDVGNALREIRDKKGYKLQFDTFDDYCRSRWGLSASSAYKQIKSAETAELIEDVYPGAQNLTERQIRAMTTLSPEGQVDFAQTHDIAAMTSRDVDKAVKEYKQQLLEANTRAELAERKLATDLSLHKTKMEKIKSKLADVEDLEEENTMLRKENKKLANKAVETVIKEVVPSDYNDLKEQNDSLTNQVIILTRSQEVNRDRYIIRDILHDLTRDNGKHIADFKININSLPNDDIVKSDIQACVILLEGMIEELRKHIKGDVFNESCIDII